MNYWDQFSKQEIDNMHACVASLESEIDLDGEDEECILENMCPYCINGCNYCLMTFY